MVDGATRVPDRHINGRLWWKGERVYAYPCTVTLNEDAVPGRSVQGSCSHCESTHYVDTKQLGKRWRRVIVEAFSEGDQ